jgi:hypothetical protein
MKKTAYVILIIFVAGISASFGAAGGAMLVYQLEQGKLLSTQSIDQPGAISSVEIGVDRGSTETIFINNIDVETTITQVVQQVGPAVVTVVGTIPGQMTYFRRTSSSEVSGRGCDRYQFPDRAQQCQRHSS